MCGASLALLILLIILILCIIGSTSYVTCQETFKRKRQNSGENSGGGGETSGWQLYMRKGCPHCTHQKDALNGFKNYIEYKPDGSILENPMNISPAIPFGEIKGFPMWYNTTTKATKMGNTPICSLSPKVQGC